MWYWTWMLQHIWPHWFVALGLWLIFINQGLNCSVDELTFVLPDFRVLVVDKLKWMFLQTLIVNYPQWTLTVMWKNMLSLLHCLLPPFSLLWQWYQAWFLTITALFWSTGIRLSFTFLSEAMSSCFNPLIFSESAAPFSAYDVLVWRLALHHHWGHYLLKSQLWASLLFLFQKSLVWLQVFGQEPLKSRTWTCCTEQLLLPFKKLKALLNL